jgi:hypothetical protein
MTLLEGVEWMRREFGPLDEDAVDEYLDHGLPVPPAPEFLVAREVAGPALTPETAAVPPSLRRFVLTAPPLPRHDPRAKRTRREMRVAAARRKLARHGIYVEAA